MVKIKLIARESLTDGRVSVSLEPLISRGTDKEQKAGTYLLLKIGKMLEDLEDEVNSIKEIAKALGVSVTTVVKYLAGKE